MAKATNYDMMKRIEDLESSMFFKKGESYAFGDNFLISGCLSTSATTLYTTLQTTKSMKNISNISASGYIYAVRGINGYVDIINTNTSLDDFTVIATKIDDYHIYLRIKKDTAFNATNNTLVNMQFNSLKLTFS